MLLRLQGGFLSKLQRMTAIPSLPQNKRLQWLEFLVLVAALVISCAVILGGDGSVPSPPMDQHFVETVNLKIQRTNGHWQFQYPNLQYAGGISSSLAAGLYKLIIPTSHSNLNWHFRIFCMAGLLLSSFYLFRTAIPKHAGLRIAALLVVATSGFQLVQPSSDVICGTFLNLFLIAALRSWSKPLTALFLALFGLGKVELTLGAIALSILWFAWEYRQGFSKPMEGMILTWLWIGILLLPALVLKGSNPFVGSRSTVAFLSAYTGFLRPHQVINPRPLTDEQITALTLTRVFGGAQSFPEIALNNPRLYGDFLGVSAARSIPNIGLVFKFMLLPFAGVCMSWKRISENWFLLFATLIACACILIPSWLVIFVRMRYIAKVLPAVTAATLACSVELGRKNNGSIRLAWAGASLTILWQLFQLSPYQD